MPVNSGGIFISIPLGKCASWIICRNELHHLKGFEIGFHPRFLFFFYHDNKLVYSLSKLNVIIFVNINSILFLKRHTDRKSWNLASLLSFILNDQKLKFVEENKDFWKKMLKPIANLLEDNFEKK